VLVAEIIEGDVGPVDAVGVAALVASAATGEEQSEWHRQFCYQNITGLASAAGYVIYIYLLTLFE